MAFWNKPKVVNKVETIPINYSPSMYFSASIKDKLDEKFKGEVENKKIRFPAGLGEAHPFDFQTLEELYKKFGFFTAVIDKYVDFIVGPGFYVTCDDARAKEIIDTFMQDVNFDTILRQWTKEALMKGNGFLELGLNKDKGVSGLKLLNANYMYVERDDKGKVEGYNQYTGDFNKFKQKNVISFKTSEIAHVPFNMIGDNAYGYGIGYTALKLINDWLSQNKSIHTLMDRKANAPLHAKFGYIDGDTKIIPKAEDVSAFGKDLETMDNKTNWVTDPLVEFKVVDFGNIGEKFNVVLENDMNMLIYAFQIPAVLLGMANIPEGLAKVQMEAFQRRIQSIQAELEKIIENQIFKKVLNANGLVKNSEGTEIHVEFEWGTPSVMELEGRLQLITELIKSPATGYALKTILTNELINLLKFDKDEWEKLKLEQEEKLEEERKRLEAQPQPIVPGQNAGFPPKVAPKPMQPKQPKPIKQSTKVVVKKTKKKEIINSKRTKENYESEKICANCNEGWDRINDIQEWLGFNYKEYLGHIIKATEEHDFVQLKALTESEVAAGYLSTTQIDKLKGIMKNGFEKGQGMDEMARIVDKKVELKDLYRIDKVTGEMKKGAAGLPILSRSKEYRSMLIVRTEVTRMANLGTEKYYKENGVTKETWIASFGDRTCVECSSLNGQIFEIGNHPEIPLHPMCRCTLAPFVELK